MSKSAPESASHCIGCSFSFYVWFAAEFASMILLSDQKLGLKGSEILPVMSGCRIAELLLESTQTHFRRFIAAMFVYQNQYLVSLGQIS